MKNKYFISKNVVLKGTNPETLVNNLTGCEYQLNESTLALLKLYSRPRKLKLSKREELIFKIENKSSEIMNFFIKEKILITEEFGHTAIDYKNIQLEQKNPTFYNVPYVIFDDITTKKYDFLFLGIPFDLGSTGYPGARYAPKNIRLISSEDLVYQIDFTTQKSIGWNSTDSENKILSGLLIGDCGDIPVIIGESFESYFTKIKSTVTSLINCGAVPVLIGGDHSISYSIIKGVSETLNEKIGLIHFDAHHDLSELIPGISNNHGNVFSRAHLDNTIEHHILCGIRGYSNIHEIVKKIKDSKFTIISNNDILSQDIPETTVLQNLKYHLSLDIDVLDPSIAPGTGTPVINGLSIDDFKKTLITILKDKDIVSFDLVEVNPLFDQNNRTTQIASDIILFVLNLISQKRAS